jgi:FkbM family methyltransferase
MASVRGVLKPQYIYRPSQLFRRLSATVLRRSTRLHIVRLPWGLRIRCSSLDGIGAALTKLGVFELHVSEAIWRLLDPEDIAVDAGANIGYMTSLMTVRVGAGGSVVAIEPHPEVAPELRFNVDLWSESELTAVHVEQLALSSSAGEGKLEVPTFFDRNRGTASLAGAPRSWEVANTYTVSTARLDDVIAKVIGSKPIALLKLDVEWHEEEVLRGASSLLSAGLIRDIVYEDHRGARSGATSFLLSNGYTIFSLTSSFFGPQLRPINPQAPDSEGPDYLATLAPERACARLRARGWQVLR